jgi:phosphoribosyl 1,2-cyclic phosphodiesterase/ActR/RegA family two-component response regulator
MPSALVIDDDADFRELIREFLQAAGWRVWDADGGEHGIDLARKHLPSVVVCDLLMPRGNGFQVCRALRSDPRFHATRIIVTSGRAYDSDRNAALEAGADEYLVKPFDLAALVARLRNLSDGASFATQTLSAPDAGRASGAWLKFWGVRGSIATPGSDTVRYGGNTACVEVRTGGQIIILDAGTGLRQLGRELSREFHGQPIRLNLLLSHTHWDHIQGLPFFQPLYLPDSRIRILGYEGARSGLFKVLSSQMESPYFPVGLKELPSNVQIDELRDMDFQLGEVRVQACFANHPGICVGYRLTTREGSIAFFPDNEPPQRLQHPNGAAQTGDTVRREFAAGESRKFVEFLRDVDVLIMDAQYDAAEYAQHTGWGHGCVDDVVEIAVQAGAKKLFLFHHDPDHDDAKVSSMVEHARALAAKMNSPLEIEAAREGLVVQLATANR